MSDARLTTLTDAIREHRNAGLPSEEIAAAVLELVGPKPLVWVPTKALRKHLVEGEIVIEMITQGNFLYTLVKNYQIGMSWSAYRGRYSPISNGTCVSLNAAKAAAQAHADAAYWAQSKIGDK